jgi:hypothetical protein
MHQAAHQNRMRRQNTARFALKVLVASSAFWFTACYAGVWTYKGPLGAVDTAVGEEHEVNYQSKDAVQLVQDVLRGEGILFEVQPQDQIVTFWKNADTPQPFFGSFIGMRARFRYEIQVIGEGPSKSKIVANVRTEHISDDQIEHYKASQRLDLFHKIDDLAAAIPPGPNTPSSGGVNFALLPNEDLQALAQRVTGNSANWKTIAEDNGISAPADVTAFQTIWVRSTLLKSKR